MKLRRFIAALSACSLAALAGCPQPGDVDRNSNDNASPGGNDRARPGSNDDVAPRQGDDADDTPTRHNDGVKPGQPVTDPQVPPQQQQPQPNPVPKELTGYWRTILTYLPGYYTWIIDPGDFSGSIGATYYFGADGQYRYDLDTA